MSPMATARYCTQIRANEKQGGYATYDVEDGPHRFEVRARGGGPVRLFGVVVERDRPGVVVESTYNWYWLVDGLKERG